MAVVPTLNFILCYRTWQPTVQNTRHLGAGNHRHSKTKLFTKHNYLPSKLFLKIAAATLNLTARATLRTDIDRSLRFYGLWYDSSASIVVVHVDTLYDGVASGKISNDQIWIYTGKQMMGRNSEQLNIYWQNKRWVEILNNWMNVTSKMNCQYYNRPENILFLQSYDCHHHPYQSPNYRWGVYCRQLYQLPYVSTSSFVLIIN